MPEEFDPRDRPVAFDPWTATLEDALSLSTNVDDDKRSPITQYFRAQDLSKRRPRVEQGSGFDVLAAIAECARHGLGIPAWLADLYLPRFKEVESYRAGSWDAPKAFGRPYPKGLQLARRRKDRQAAPQVYYTVNKLLAEDPLRPVDNLLFEDVSARLGNRPGLGKSECARLYYEHREQLDRIFKPRRLSAKS